jgi:hypothetical protein
MRTASSSVSNLARRLCRTNRSILGGAALAAGSLFLGSCGGGGPAGVATPQQSSPTTSETAIIPAPKGIVAATQVQPNGTLWVLSGSASVRTLEQINVVSKRSTTVVGVSASAVNVAQASTGLLALGLATPSSGAVQLLNGTSGTIEGTVQVSGPVKALVFGDDGVTLYVLDATANAASVTVINSATEQTVATFPVPGDAIGLAVDPTQTTIWTVEQSGNVQQTSLQSFKPIQSLPIDGAGIALTISSSGDTLFVLKGTSLASNITLVNIKTAGVEQVLSAAADSVGLVASASGSILYDVVGSPTFGNIQAIRLRNRP